MGFLDKFFSGPPKPDAFAKMVMAAMKKAGDKRSASYDKATFVLNFFQDGKEAGVVSLRNVYNEFCLVPKDKRQEKLHHLVKGMLSHFKEVPEHFEDVQPDLFPAVRSRCYIEFISLQTQISGNEGPTTPYTPIGDNLATCVVYDLPEAMRFITTDDCEKWGKSFFELMEIACHNLGEKPFSYASIGDKVYSIMCGDEYDSSRLLLPELVRGLKIEGDPIAMIPNRGTLLITGSEDLLGLKVLAELAEKALEEPRPMSGIPVRLTSDDEWVAWMPEGNHSSAKAFRLLELKTLSGEYADQKALLEELHKKNGTDIFVASFYGVQKTETNEVTSYCLWAKGVESLLPRTRTVVFTASEGKHVVADWEKVETVVGSMMEATDLYPPRYHVKDFPTDDQLKAMGCEAL